MVRPDFSQPSFKNRNPLPAGNFKPPNKMPEYTIYQVDAFTSEPLKGNPAGVVLGAETLSDEQMQAIARELNNSETAFVLPPDSSNHDIRVRFFTPTTEVPSCGHATLAANYVWALENQIPEGSIRQKIQIGILTVEVKKMDKARRYRITMVQDKPEFLHTLEGAQKNRLLSALELREEDLIPDVPIQIVSTGHSKVMIPLRSRRKLNSLSPDLNMLKELSSQIECNGYFPFTLDSDDPGILTHARMFAPAIGIPEDPVTGNGNGPLGAYLIRYDLVEYDGSRFTFISKQGEAMMREGLARIEVEIERGQPKRVKVGGEATILYKARVTL